MRGGAAGSGGVPGWREIAQWSRPVSITQKPSSALQNEMQIQANRMAYSSSKISSIGLRPSVWNTLTNKPIASSVVMATSTKNTVRRKACPMAGGV